MMTFVAILHILVALLLIGLVLVQDSKGGGALGMGGGSNSVLGAAGAQTLWAKLTRVIALIFAMTCISLSYMTAQKTRSIIDSTPIPSVPAASSSAAGGAAAPTDAKPADPVAPAEKAALPVETPAADAPTK